MDVQIIKRSQLPEHQFAGADHGGAGVSLEGEATFVVDGNEIAAGPDDVVIVPGNTPHGFTNTGGGPLRMVNIHVSPVFNTDWL
jgi:quercetin dioxygenase-like cupin family protein